MTRRRAASLALLGGGMAALGHAPFAFWPVALAGLGLAGWAVASAPNWRAGFWRGWLAGAVFFAVTLHWIVEPFLVEPERYGLLAAPALVAMACGLALFWGAAGALGVALAPAPRVRGLALAVTLAGAEFARSHVLTGFPWALLAYVWIETPVYQLAALIGPHALGLATLALLALPGLARGMGLRAGLGALTLAGLAGGWFWGAARLAQPDPARAEEAPMVRLVQPNAAQHLKWLPEEMPRFFDIHLDLTAQPAAHAPDLVIWSETAVPFLLDAPGAGLERARAALPEGARLALGLRRYPDRQLFNALAVIGPDGDVEAIYDKHHLVPFGEYIPFERPLTALGLYGLATGGGIGFSPGPGPQVLDLGDLGRVLPLICYEAIFPYAVRDVPARPDWILHITNDAWFGRFAGPFQHFDQARARAVEFGLPVVRVANTGVSGVIDARGRVIVSLGLGERGFLDAAVPGALPPTPYSRLAEVPFWALFTILSLASAIFGRVLAIDPKTPHE